MANEIQTKLNTWAGFTITLASLAASGARQSTMLANTGVTQRRRAATIFLGIMSGVVAPTAGRIYEIFFLGGDDAGNRDDNAGATDAAITIENSYLLGGLTVTATINKKFSRRFDSVPLGELSTEWGIAVRNGSDQALNATETNHVKRHAPYLPEVQ